jgi:hypothetical protein
MDRIENHFKQSKPNSEWQISHVILTHDVYIFFKKTWMWYGDYLGRGKGPGGSLRGDKKG